MLKGKDMGNSFFFPLPSIQTIKIFEVLLLFKLFNNNITQFLYFFNAAFVNCDSGILTCVFIDSIIYSVPSPV